MNGEVLFMAFELFLYAVLVFLALILKTRTTDFSWQCIITSILISFVGTVFKLLTYFGILIDIPIFGIPLISACFSTVAAMAFIIALISKINSKYK